MGVAGILCDLKHKKDCAYVSLSISESRMNKLLSVLDIQGVGVVLTPPTSLGEDVYGKSLGNGGLIIELISNTFLYLNYEFLQVKHIAEQPLTTEKYY